MAKGKGFELKLFKAFCIQDGGNETKYILLRKVVGVSFGLFIVNALLMFKTKELLM